MFERLGVFASRHRIPIIVFWVAAAVILMAVAPPVEDVSTTDQADFLSDDAPFAQAQKIYQDVFPDEFSPSSTMVLVDAGEGGDVHAAAGMDFVAELEAWLNSASAPDNIQAVVAPTTDPQLAERLISPDGRIALVSVSLATATDAVATTQAVNDIADWLEANDPAGLDVYQTGEAALNAQAEKSTFETMDRTLIITVVLVIVALLAIYRSPVSPLIPLFGVTIAFLVTLGLVSILADLEVIIAIAQVVTLLIVVMYGAGTDYCLFLISRFREEMANDLEVEEATKHTVHMVGETISSSAGTIFVGFVSMVLAEMGMFRNAGPTLALGIAVMLLAGLTLVPALLAALGNRAFWPGKASHRSAGRFYEATSKLVSSRPLVTILIIVAIMAPFSVYGLSQDLNYDSMSELPEEIESVKAYHLLREHMGGGNLFPLTVVVTGQNPDALPAQVVRLTRELKRLPAVEDVRGLNDPLGTENEQINDLLRPHGQLMLLLSMDEEGEEEGAIDSAAAQQAIQGLQGYLALVSERFPQITDSENFTIVQDILDGGLVGIAARQGELMAAVGGLVGEFRNMEDAYLMPPTGEGEILAMLQPLVDSYTADNGTAFRLEVVLDDPLSVGALESIDDIRDVLADYEEDGDAVVSGFTAMIRDIQAVMERDQFRMFGFILAGIFVVLLLMLRSVVAPLYLIGTVVLSFTCTLGLTNLFFDVVYDVDKLSWMLPVFMFVFLVALGIDYSIFLFGRIKEEVGYHGIREGVHVAVAATGAIITSAGVILAGTFAGMLAGEIMMLKQLGFAVSVGVLIDTFVVRTMLDPALATLFGRWTWWPGGVPKAPAVRPEKQVPAIEAGD